MIYYQLKMIYLPGKNDLFAKQKWFILNHKTLGTIQLFWQAVLRINHLNGSHHSSSFSHSCTAHSQALTFWCFSCAWFSLTFWPGALLSNSSIWLLMLLMLNVVILLINCCFNSMGVWIVSEIRAIIYVIRLAVALKV